MSAMALFGEVLEIGQLAPRMRRVVLGGEGLAGYSPTPWTDEYVNALFLPPGAPYGVPFDLDEARRSRPEHRPRGRRYTVRSWDGSARRLTLDIVTHGDVGLAGRWAETAGPGDLLQLVGPSGGYAPDPGADWHLMVGDESALPAIARSLQNVTPGTRVLAVIVVDDGDTELALACPGELELTWVHRRAEPDTDDQLVRTVEKLAFPDGRPQVFVHGEAGEVRSVRRHLLGERGIAKEGASISPYWRRTLTDEEWRAVKRDWLAESERDV
jgi:NADPH-dependent ferric siderophore reductase